MIEFEVGARPSRPLSIAVRDELDNPVSLLGYTGYTLEIKGTNDEDVDLTGVQVVPLPQAAGILAIYLPTNRSLFEEKGKYLLRLVMTSQNGAKDITRTTEIRVRDFGRLN